MFNPIDDPCGVPDAVASLGDSGRGPAELSRSVPPCRRAGFSLIEVLSVMVLMTIASGMAAPRVTAMLTRAQAESVLNQLATDVALTRSLALRNRYPAALTFDASGTAYSITSTDASGSRVVKRVDLRSETANLAIQRSAAGPISFNSRGHLVSSGGENLTVTAQVANSRNVLRITRLGRVYRD